MILQVLHCPRCYGTSIVRHGQTRQGKQRYRCREQPCAGGTFLLNCTYIGQWAKASAAVGLEWARAEFLGKGQSLISSQMRLRARCTASYSLRLALNYNCDFSWHVAEFFSHMLAVP